MLPDVKAKFEAYPEGVRSIMLAMRQLILSVAEENQLGADEEA